MSNPAEELLNVFDHWSQARSVDPRSSLKAIRGLDREDQVDMHLRAFRAVSEIPQALDDMAAIGHEGKIEHFRPLVPIWMKLVIAQDLTWSAAVPHAHMLPSEPIGQLRSLSAILSLRSILDSESALPDMVVELRSRSSDLRSVLDQDESLPEFVATGLRHLLDQFDDLLAGDPTRKDVEGLWKATTAAAFSAQAGSKDPTKWQAAISRFAGEVTLQASASLVANAPALLLQLATGV
ncbi:hypothetical protein [Agrococcus terreus]|uniref:Uncharacterized protein n=1 Tax=Agrococcus terreus TaxID=574649 RepID=A0ABQ2KPQ7_9MICO|nr:hypothetical protein [Agrococcus terreus]GGN89335.1 hypothetical protein GCM10010968_25880 [Agrococcus terreus]